MKKGEEKGGKCEIKRKIENWRIQFFTKPGKSVAKKGLNISISWKGEKNHC